MHAFPEWAKQSRHKSSEAGTIFSSNGKLRFMQSLRSNSGSNILSRKRFSRKSSIITVISTKTRRAKFSSRLFSLFFFLLPLLKLPPSGALFRRTFIPGARESFGSKFCPVVWKKFNYRVINLFASRVELRTAMPCVKLNFKEPLTMVHCLLASFATKNEYFRSRNFINFHHCHDTWLCFFYKMKLISRKARLHEEMLNQGDTGLAIIITSRELQPRTTTRE